VLDEVGCERSFSFVVWLVVLVQKLCIKYIKGMGKSGTR
jgi:hypothetical protein